MTTDFVRFWTTDTLEAFCFSEYSQFLAYRCQISILLKNWVDVPMFGQANIGFQNSSIVISQEIELFNTNDLVI